MKTLFLPVIDNGMGLSRTSWATSLACAAIEVLSRYKVIFRQISYPYPDGAMNIATNEFLNSGADEMLVIDTDLVFQPWQLASLLSHDQPLVFGLYPKKSPGLTFPVEWLTEENPFSKNPFSNDAPRLVEVKRVARGLMRAHRSVFEKLSLYVPQYTDAHSGQRSFSIWKTLPGGHSEDFAFCDLWRFSGGRVLVDQRASVQHEGSAVYPIPGTF